MRSKIKKEEKEKINYTAIHQNILKKVLVHLSSVGIFCYQNTTGATKASTGRYLRFGFPGSPDILGIMPDGTYLGIEIKSGNAIQSKAQKRFQRKIEDNNGVYLVIRSLDQLKEWLNE